jgi:LuxR family maltose regulon positive regulatory protein
MATTAAVWLAATKLVAPARRRDVLHRERLTSALADSLEHSRLTLISAPAGAGKTTLLSEIPHVFPDTTWAWLLLDAEDNDPSRFVAALMASLETTGLLVPGVDSSDPRAAITAIINELARDPRTVGIVLDDLHTISERSVHELLDYFLDNLPPRLRFVLATRHDPPMALARRRARGEIGEVRMQDLGFTEEETGELANRCLGLGLGPEEIKTLYTRTEGWAAGLRLLATSLSQSPNNRSTVLQSGMQGSRRIFDFLAEEVLDRQTPSLRSFLLETSILSSLRPSVCDSLTGRNDSAQLLEDLYRRNLYVVAADESETSFRYHDLFADFLRERLRRERPNDWATLHERAAQAEASPQERMRHLLAAQSWDAAADEIAVIGPDYILRGFLTTLKRWITTLPDEARLRNPRTLYLLGYAVWTQSEFSQAQPYLEQALEGFRRNKDFVGQGEALAALSNAALMNNQLEEARDLLKEALSFDLTEASRLQIHSVSVWDAIYRQDWEQVESHLSEVYRLVALGGATNPLAIMVLLFGTGLPGGVDRLEKVCIALRPISGPEAGEFAMGCYHLLWGAVILNRGDLSDCNDEALLAMALAQNCGQIVLIAAALCTTFSVVGTSSGNWADAEAWARDSGNEKKYGQISRMWRLHGLLLLARAQLGAGNIEGLRQTYEASIAPNPYGAPAALAYRHLIRGMLRLAERSYAQAEHAFREALQAEQTFRVTRAISSAQVMLGHILLLRGQAVEAMEVFTPYLRECEESNLPGYLTRDNPSVIPLLRHARERGICAAFCEKVLDILGAPFDAVEAAGGEALSDRELEVLRVLADGLGNREIAEKLFVSEATVKTHVQRIMRKLDAASRTQAVARARELMLI